MSHDIDQMFSVNLVPWHKDLTGDSTMVAADYPQDWDTARKWAGLDWEPIETPCYTLAGMNDDGTDRYEIIGDWKSIARSDTGKVLAVTHDTYPIINHSAFGEILEAVLIQDKDNLKFETGGVLAGGRAVWMLVSLDEPIMIPGDSSATLPYIAVTARHDATAAVTLRATAVRVVCANTFRAAEMEGERTGATYAFQHRGDWRARISEAREAVTLVHKEIAEYVELATGLLGVKVTAAQQELFVSEFIPAPPEGLISDRVRKNIAMARGQLTQILGSETVDGAGISGTAYGLVQAAGEYADHARKAQSWESKLNRTILRPEPLKARALKLALAVAGN